MKTSKKLLSILLSVLLVVMTVSCLAVCFTAIAWATIQFGNYPQGRVTETTALKNAAAAATWKSYGYYKGHGRYDGDNNCYDGLMYKDDFMKYADFYLNGSKYRAVKFTGYRPEQTSYVADNLHSNQDENGYLVGKTYYFLYQALNWWVIDSSTGLVLCDKIIDAQAYQNVIWKASEEYYIGVSSTYANNYAQSSILNWLNDDFYNTAFSAAQKEKIKPASTGSTKKVYLLPEGFTRVTRYSLDSNYSRQVKGTDYAKCQGLLVGDSGYSLWWLSTSGEESGDAVCVGDNGSIYETNVDTTSIGVRPICYLTSLTNDTSMDTYTITVSASPAAGGTVSGGGTYYKGETATVKATSKLGYRFTGWYYRDKKVSSNETYTFTVGANGNLVAEFEQVPTYTVTVTASPTEGGTVTGGGTYVKGETVTVTATPKPGYKFVKWEQCIGGFAGQQIWVDLGFTPSYTIQSNTTDRDFRAVFEKDASTDPGTPDPGTPDPGTPESVCPWCGGQHVGFFQGIIGFFHGIFAKLFGARY